MIDGSMFHVQALVALFSGTEAAPWVANEWTRGGCLGGDGGERVNECVSLTPLLKNLNPT